jgi:hypothetical protein
MLSPELDGNAKEMLAAKRSVNKDRGIASSAAWTLRRGILINEGGSGEGNEGSDRPSRKSIETPRFTDSCNRTAVFAVIFPLRYFDAAVDETPSNFARSLARPWPFLYPARSRAR